MEIGDFNIEKNVFLIAELSANHQGDLELAKETIRAAKRAGADCIKLQTYTPDTITLNVRNDYFKIDQGTAWDGRYLYDLYQEAHTPWKWHKELFDIAREEGLICFSSPFDNLAVDLLEELEAPAYKIASFEITDIPLISYVASKGKPIIISTGIADESDIRMAIDACKEKGNDKIAVLHCTSAYPAKSEDANLLTIPEIKRRFDVVVGLSDHTLGIEAPIAAVALGARIIEKHFILDKKLGGVDSHFSLDESSFGRMTKAVRRVEKMLGKVDLQMSDKKLKSREFSRSLFVAKDMKEGDVITNENVRSVRPGYGMHPKYFDQVLGKRVICDLKAGTPLDKKFISEGLK